MIFPTVEFAVFFAVVLSVSWVLMPWPVRWRLFILGASYFFYGFTDYRWCLLLFGSTVFNQLMAELIHRARHELTKSRLLVIAVAGNLVALGFFKYYGFFVDSVAGALTAVHLRPPLPLLQVALPVGISFFTFQALSYVIDVRRRQLAPASPIDFAVFLAFFPHLVAGPIVRASEFLPQLRRPRDPLAVPAARAFRLILGGLIKKIVIADVLASSLVDSVFTTPGQHSRGEILVGIYGYAVQIYCDFSAYSDIAIGVALLLGFRFPENFDAPYAAVSLQDFWRRWHMSLSRWLRDYLYIPLGGSRGGPKVARRNLMVTMLLGGLWHGAAWHFVIWGGLHGGGLAVERSLAERHGSRRRQTLRQRAVARVVTFHLVCFAWLFFRADSLGVVREILWRLLTAGGPSPAVTTSVLMAIAVGIGVQYLPRDAWRRAELAFARLSLVPQVAALAVTVVVVDALGNQGVAPFIYFQF
jgi:alginate O-acetyltransferase complex protein AlgI